jgi:hypothetical protein
MQTVPLNRLQRSRLPFTNCRQRTLSFHRRTRDSPSLRCSASVKSGGEVPSSAKDAVEAGDRLFKNKDYEEALALYEKALQLSPNDDEARAAHYNAACAHTKLKQWPQAADSARAAINDYNLKLQVALEVRWPSAACAVLCTSCLPTLTPVAHISLSRSPSLLETTAIAPFMGLSVSKMEGLRGLVSQWCSSDPSGPGWGTFVNVMLSESSTSSAMFVYTCRFYAFHIIQSEATHAT